LLEELETEAPRLGVGLLLQERLSIRCCWGSALRKLLL
jgi:hypothetical protein